MRELTSHKVNGVNDGLTIKVFDEPSHGGACHNYGIILAEKTLEGVQGQTDTYYAINFQNGPIKEVGTNGITHEALLAILIDRLEGFQSGQYACQENAGALECLQHAQLVLKSRTEKRLARGVEGTHAI